MIVLVVVVVLLRWTAWTCPWTLIWTFLLRLVYVTEVDGKERRGDFKSSAVELEGTERGRMERREGYNRGKETTRGRR